MSRPWIVALVLFAAVASRARSFSPKTDNEIVALDLRTGKLLWAHVPATLSDAHFEVHAGALVAFPHYSQAERSSPIVLDRRTGRTLTKAPSGPVLARSATFWPPPEVKLANGWVLHGFSQGNSKTLEFQDPATKKIVWTIAASDYPEYVRAWDDVVFYAHGYLGNEAVIYACPAGATQPRWTVDVNAVLGLQGRDRLTRVALQVIGGTLYAEANEHVFAIDPATGKLRWRMDLARALGVKFEPDIYGGALNLAVFAEEQGVLVVAFEKRVVAIDTAKRKVLWHLEPDTFPHCPYPAVEGGVVYLTSGARRQLHP